MPHFSDLVAVGGGYLAGSVSFAVVVCRTLNLPDPRNRGSGNPGATNVARLAGKLPAALTLCGDVAKTVVPMLLVRALGYPETTVALVGLAAFIGHVYPLYHRFRGGKGVAAFLGVLTVLQWQMALIWIALWLAVFLPFRYVSAASMTASLAIPFYAWGTAQPQWLILLVSAATLLILIRHADNVRNLLNHPEREK